MVTYEQLEEAKEELKMYEVSVNTKMNELKAAKEAFDMEAKTGEVKSFTINWLLMTMSSYTTVLKAAEAKVANVSSLIALYDYEQKLKES